MSSLDRMPRTARRKSPTLSILGRPYRLTRKAGGDALGVTDYTRGIINVSPDQDEYSTRDTLLHEVMHAVLFQAGRSTGDPAEYPVEESYVRPLATGLIAFFRANPEVAAWLIANPEAV